MQKENQHYELKNSRVIKITFCFILLHYIFCLNILLKFNFSWFFFSRFLPLIFVNIVKLDKKKIHYLNNSMQMWLQVLMLESIQVSD